jgi:hypothetical protein
MKRILLFLCLFATTVAYSQRQIPKGGSIGQVIKIGSDGTSIIWSNPGAIVTYKTPLSVSTNTVQISKGTGSVNGYIGRHLMGNRTLCKVAQTLRP